MSTNPYYSLFIQSFCSVGPFLLLSWDESFARDEDRSFELHSYISFKRASRFRSEELSLKLLGYGSGSVEEKEASPVLL